MLPRISGFVLLSALIVGCSGSTPGPKLAAVRVKVTLDAQPLASGTITFDKGDGTSPNILPIRDGAYGGEAAPGSTTVRIGAYKTVPVPNPPGMSGPLYDNKTAEQNYLPVRYHSASKDVREVRVGIPNEFDFAVTSK